MAFQVLDTQGRIKGAQTPSEFSLTTTGTINNLDFLNADLIRFNNASAAILTGLKAGYAGQSVVIQNIGSSTVQISHQGGTSDAANRAITISTNGQIVGAGGSMLAIYDGTTLKWRVSVIDPGGWIPIAFDAANFTGAAAMTWTVGAGDQATYVMRQEGAQVTILIFLVDTTVGGVPAASLLILVPGGFTLNSALESPTLGKVVDSGVNGFGSIQRSDDTHFSINNATAVAWTAAVNTTRVFFGATFAVL